MSLTVALSRPAIWGAGVGRRLTENGVTVLTSLAGRSAESEKRAREAGMTPVEDRALMDADFLLSIVPPGDALALAKRMAGRADRGQQEAGLTLNATRSAPKRCEQIADVIAAAGATFIGAGIIGPPLKPGSKNTKIYASGPHARELAVLNDHGLIVRVLEGPLTAASALKMSYAGITKGFTALGASMMLAATREGAAAALQHRTHRKPAGSARLPDAPDAGDVCQGLSLGGRA